MTALINGSVIMSKSSRSGYPTISVIVKYKLNHILQWSHLCAEISDGVHLERSISQREICLYKSCVNFSFKRHSGQGQQVGL